MTLTLSWNIPRNAQFRLLAVIVEAPVELPKPAVPISFSLNSVVLDVPSGTDCRPTFPMFELT